MNPVERVQTNPINVHVERAKADALRTESIEVILADVVMSGAAVGPDLAPEPWGRHRSLRDTRDRALAWVSCVLRAAVFLFLIVTVVLIEAGKL